MTSTAVASAGARPTQNFIVATTQNTAPVLDFKCLYTYDLRRKQKRWQDGLLRFHTFNKRIMVYDVPRNYIGDTHWRDDDIIGDGDEFELDRGVLIQVGEAAGSMEQDLTELLEKRNKPQVSVSEQATSSPMGDPLTTTMASPAVPQTSLLRPKSLNTLLGTRKGPIGRASIPKKSPHEMRKARADIGCTIERPSKRPRLADSGAAVPTSVIPQLGRSSSPSRSDPTPLGGEQESSGVIHVSKYGKNRFSTSSITAQSPPGGQRLYAVAAPIARETVSAAKPRADNRVKHTRKQRERGEENPRRKVGAAPPGGDETQPRPAIIAATGSPQNSLASWKETSAESVEIISDVEAASSSEPRNKRTKLQMASRKPRRKLMYRDLLPPDSSTISRLSSSTECTAQGGRMILDSSGSERPSKKPLTEFHKRQLDQVADRLNGRPSNEGARNASNKNKDPSKSMSSSLFLTQEDSDKPWMERHKMTDNLADTHNVRCIEDASEEHPTPTRSTRALKPRQRSIPKASSTVHDTELTLTKMDEILLRPQSKPPLPRRPKETAVPVSPIRTCSPSPIPSPPQDFLPNRPPQNVAPPPKSTISSPTPKIPSPAPPPKPPPRPLLPLPLSHSTNPITTTPSHPVKPLPKIPLLTTRPLKPLKSRSQLKLKQSISDPSNMYPARPPLTSVLDAKTAKEPAREENGTGSAWGKEAWDLFGCGRDGIECTYEEFKRKEGLL